MKFLSLTFLLLLFPTLVHSAPPKKECNDLKVSQCRSREDCRWVKKSKDGKKAHCRKKAGKSKGNEKN